MVNVITKKKPYSCLVTEGIPQLQADTTLEKGGGNTGFRPHDLLASALGSCIAISLKMFATSRNIPVQSISVEVEIDRSIPNKTVFRKKIALEGDISEDDRKLMMAAAATGPIQKILSRQLEFIIE